MEEEILGEVDDFLQEIEKKYSEITISSRHNDFDEQLQILLQEFETLGLPSVNSKRELPEVFKQVVSNTRMLIQVHRTTLSQINDLGMNSKYKDTKNHDLIKNIINLKKKLKDSDHRNITLEAKLCKLNNEGEDLRKNISMHRDETDKMKRYFKSKQNELIHQINNLKNENLRLKEICGQDIDKYLSKEDKFLQIVKKHKQNEMVYKKTIQKLEDNNSEILNEIVNLKEELASVYSKKEY